MGEERERKRERGDGGREGAREIDKGGSGRGER